MLRGGTEYELVLSVGESSVESYVDPDEGVEPVREGLYATWFVAGGETDKARTSFLRGDPSMDKLRTIRWVTPTADEIADNQARLFVVLRDDRGATTWLSRTVSVEDAP